MNLSVNGMNINGFNPNPRRQKVGIGTLIMMVIIGLILAGAGGAIYKSSQINSSWVKEEGTVTGSNFVSGAHGSTYAPIVQYKVNNQTYSVQSSESSSTIPALGTQKQVAYNPNDPSQAKVVSSSGGLFGIVFALLGVVVLVLGPVLYVKSKKRTQDINNLKVSGQKVTGVLVDIQETSMTNNAMSINNGLGMDNGLGTGMNNGMRQINYKIVVAATTPDGSVQNYVSDTLTGVGPMIIASMKGQPIPIDVYINPSNPKDYYVDITELPNLTASSIAEMVRGATQTNTIPVSSTPIVTQASRPTNQEPPTTPIPPAQPPASV